jgi:hypothetical protein
MDVRIERIEGGARDGMGQDGTHPTCLIAIEKLHGKAGFTPFFDERRKELRLLLEEVRHAAARAELEVVELLDELVVEAPAGQAELHLHASRSHMEPHEARVATR